VGLPQVVVQIMGDLASTKKFSRRIRETLNIVNFIDTNPEYIPRFIDVGLVQVLVQVMGAIVSTKKDNYILNELKEVLKIVGFIYISQEYIPRFITDGLLQALLQIFHPQYFQECSALHRKIIKDLCNYDSNICQQFNELGVPKKSKKKRFMTYLKDIAKGP